MDRHLLAQLASNEFWDGPRQAPDPVGEVPWLVCGRPYQKTGTGKAGGRDGDTDVQRGWEEDMVVFGAHEGGGQHARAAKPYLMTPTHMHVVHCPYQQ